ncbi:MAG: SIS domain-containing protein [Magnetovibrionaceae bacterium]
MTFPDQRYGSAGAFADEYFARIAEAGKSVNRDALEAAAQLMAAGYQRGATLYVCGNGGSACISDSFVCDHAKLIQTDTTLKPRVVSLASNVAMLTAIGNDISYDDIFVYPLQTSAQAGDMLLTVSASGNSENVVRALQWAKDNGLETISFTGFEGGRSAEIADVNLHVQGDNYGVIEDTHQSLMHILAQHIRSLFMDEGVIRDRKF